MPDQPTNEETGKAEEKLRPVNPDAVARCGRDGTLAPYQDQGEVSDFTCGLSWREINFCNLLFAQKIKDPVQAMRDAGFRYKHDKQMEGHARKLLYRPNVKKYLKNLRQRAAKLAGFNADDVLSELINIATVNPADFFEFGPDGVTVRDKSDLTKAQLSCIKSVSSTTRKDGAVHVKLEFHDKLKAIELIGKDYGMFIERRMIELHEKKSLHIDQRTEEVMDKVIGKFIDNLRTGAEDEIIDADFTDTTEYEPQTPQVKLIDPEAE